MNKPMTMTQKILAAHAGKPYVEAGELVLVDLDMVLANDVTAPVAINEFGRFGKENVSTKQNLLVMDHFAQQGY